VLSFERRAAFPGVFEYRKAALALRRGGAGFTRAGLCGADRCGPGSHVSLTLRNVWGSAPPEAIVDLYTGGAHCCFQSFVLLSSGRLLFRNWGDPGYRIERRAGTTGFVSADDRFAYAFTAFAGSALPVQVWSIDRAGRFVDVTSTRLDLVRADAARAWRGYVHERGKRDTDVRGVVAGWCADEYRLGRAAACRAELARALGRGFLDGPTGWPRNAAFVRALERSLGRWGY
jgi:hypothetical protein